MSSEDEKLEDPDPTDGDEKESITASCSSLDGIRYWSAEMKQRDT